VRTLYHRICNHDTGRWPSADQGQVSYLTLGTKRLPSGRASSARTCPPRSHRMQDGSLMSVFVSSSRWMVAIVAVLLAAAAIGVTVVNVDTTSSRYVIVVQSVHTGGTLALHPGQYAVGCSPGPCSSSALPAAVAKYLNRYSHQVEVSFTVAPVTASHVPTCVVSLKNRGEVLGHVQAYLIPTGSSESQTRMGMAFFPPVGQRLPKSAASVGCL
jgi:hypothetical protein